MAKQLVNPIEQHVEKALLGFAGIALIAVVVMYVVRSPSQVEIDGEMVTPSEIDAKLATQASEVKEQIRSFRPQEFTIEPLVEEFASSLNPFRKAKLSTELRAALLIGPEVPFVDPKGAKPGQAQLVKVQTLDKPLVSYGRSTYLLQGDAVLRPANWVTVASLINREEQAKVQALEYGSHRRGVIFGPPQFQRRAMRFDGTWSDDDWRTVEPWPKVQIPSLPNIVFEDEDGRPIVPRENRQSVEHFQEDLRLPPMQMNVLRPLVPDFDNGTGWAFPPVVQCLDLLQMDDDYINATVLTPTPQTALEDRYGVCNTVVAAAPQVTLNPKQQIDQWFAEGEEFLARAKQTDSENDATQAHNSFVMITLDKNANPAQKSRADKKRIEAEQLIRDIRRRGRRGGGGGGIAAQQDQERKLQPTQLIWVHDGAPGSIESGKTYQYRIRATLFNRLAGEPSKFENSNDAKVVFIPGDWSEPSDAVTIPPTSEFYITGVDARRKIVKVEMYQWFDGFWVTTRESFKVGERVAATKRVELPDPEDPDGIDRAPVDFDTGFSVLRIVWDRMQREKKRRGSGVRFQDTMSKGSSVLLVGNSGAVVERFVSTDKAHPGKKSAASRVWRPAGKR